MAFTYDEIDQLVENAEYIRKTVVSTVQATGDTRADIIKILVKADAETHREQKAKPIPRAMPSS